jgi:hypothetical protein
MREALKMMLEDSEQPIFNEAAEMQLRWISRAEFYEFLEFNFEASGKLITEKAFDNPLSVTDCNPMRGRAVHQALTRRSTSIMPPARVGCVRRRGRSRLGSRTSSARLSGS